MHLKKYFYFLLFLILVSGLIAYKKGVFATWTMNTNSPSCNINLITGNGTISIEVTHSYTTTTGDRTGDIVITNPTSGISGPAIGLESCIGTTCSKKYTFTTSGTLTEVDAEVTNLAGNSGTCTKTYTSAWIKVDGGDVHVNE